MAVVRLATVAAISSVALVALAVTGCGSTGPNPAPVESTSAVPTAPTDARAQLAGLAAAAKDRRMVAFYTLSARGRTDRTVAVTLAGDGSWRIDVPGGAHGGAVDITMSAGPNGQVHQCALPSQGWPGNQCVRVGDREHAVPSKVDPRVHHPFTDWLDVLIDRRAALSVAPVRPEDGVRGFCFSLELTAASLVAPVDAGIYCFDADGTLTALTAGFGRLVLASAPAPAPPTVPLPGPVVAGAALPTAAPPPPPSPSVTP
jgi:hypothetical protein